MHKFAIIIGNSDGIGLGLTKELLRKGWKVSGISRSPSPLNDREYSHIVAEVQEVEFPGLVLKVLGREQVVDLCVYCAGIGELLNVSDMAEEVKVMEVNLTGMIRLASLVIPKMVQQKRGHLIGISSVADATLSEEAPSYHASKAGFSNYLESLALGLKSHDVQVSNVRFGFVDTKMAKADVKPFMMSVEKAVSHICTCIHKKPVRMTRPRMVIPLIFIRNRMLRLKNLLG